MRTSYTQEAREKLQRTHGKQYSAFTMLEAEQDLENILWEEEKRLEPQEENSQHTEIERKRSKQDRER